MSKGLLARMADGMVALEHAWGRATIAFIMVERSLSGDPYVTPSSLAAQMRVSDDSTRRWLGRLVRRGLVTAEIVDGQRCYRATPEATACALKVLNWGDVTKPQPADERHFPDG